MIINDTKEWAMKSELLLDKIETQHNTYHGIIDYSSAKSFIFYDFSESHDPDFLSIALIWKAYYKHKRFSIFVSEFFPVLSLNEPIFIPRKDSTVSRDVPKHSPRRKVMGRIKSK